MMETMKPLDTYLSLCTEVYELSKPNAPEDAYAFYLEYAKAAQGAILEPMCGTGRFLLPLLESGFNISGFDASDSMLTKLKEKAKKSALSPKVTKMFIEEFCETDKYKLIMIPSGSFCLLSDLELAAKTLCAFYDALTTGGVLLLEIITPVGDPSRFGLWEGSVWRYNEEKKILLSILSSLQNNVLSTICKYELIENNILTATEVEDMTIRLYNEEDISPLLNQAGFSNIKCIKAFDSALKPDPKDEVVIYECRK